jgi:hypothetical protein
MVTAESDEVTLPAMLKNALGPRHVDNLRLSHKSVLGRARLQPCRSEPGKTRALAPEVRSPPTVEDYEMASSFSSGLSP